MDELSGIKFVSMEEMMSWMGWMELWMNESINGIDVCSNLDRGRNYSDGCVGSRRMDLWMKE